MAATQDQRRTPAELMDAAAQRSRGSLRARVAHLRESGLTIAQAALAAGLAWLVAHELLGHHQPFFAPTAAILTLGLTFGQRGRRAAEIAVGVALGIGVGDLIVLGIGTGSWQIAIVVALAMGSAVLLGGGTLLVSQAAVSAVLVATLQPPSSGLSGARFLDALIGAAIALLVNALIPTDPVRLVRRKAEPVLAELAGALEDIAEALEQRDRDAAQRALGRARAIDADATLMHEALDVGHQTTRMAPPRRRSRARLRTYAIAARNVDNAVRNTRVLARGAIRAVELDEHVPRRAIEAVRELATSVQALGAALADPGAADAVEEAALRAAALSTAALEDTANMSASVIVGQIRSTSVDLLRGLGVDGDEARSAVRDARARLGV